MNLDEQWMERALIQARESEVRGEIPIGALLVIDQQCVAEAGNRSIADHDPSAHAEIVVLREAGRKRHNYRFPGSTMYITVEPCVMCMGAILQARVSKLVFGAYNLRGGACGSTFDLSRHPVLNHGIAEVYGGVLEAPCKALIQNFFRNKKRS